MKKPLEFKTNHRVKFSQLDPYQHMNTEHYAGYFLDHRMTGLRENLGWDLKSMLGLPFAVFVRRLEIDFLKPAVGDQELFIKSFVREFKGPDAYIECNMTDAKERNIARCLMVAACVDLKTNKAVDWPAETVALFYEKESS